MTNTRLKRLGVILVFAIVISSSYVYVVNKPLSWFFSILFGLLGYWLSTVIVPDNKSQENKE